MSEAYQQICLTEHSCKHVVINTHQGLFQYNRLPFGVASAQGILRCVMECILGGLSGMLVYPDDILITGPTDEQRLETPNKASRQLDEAGLFKERHVRFLSPVSS